MNDLFNLEGKIAVVTGGAGTLGSEMAKGLAQCGATTYIAEIDHNKAKGICDDLQKADLDIQFVELDITEESSILDCVEEILGHSNKIDIWVNNAYPRTKDWGVPFERVPIESFRKNIDMHLNGYCICCQKVAERMKEEKAGSIINMSSIYGVVGPDFTVYEGTNMTMIGEYATIKGGIVNFTRFLASYYGKHGVRVNTVSPGGIFANQPEAFVKNYSHKTPLKRMGTPQDIVGGVVYLASDASKYVTGHNLIIDGGWSAI